MLDLISESNAVALVGLIGGIALGLAARLGRFCTLGAIEDSLYSSNTQRLRMWGIAIGVALIGTQLAIAFGVLNTNESFFLNSTWNPFASVIGGLMFGYGMALSGNCGYGALARLGGGDLRSLVILIFIGISAYFVLNGPLAHLRVWLFTSEEAVSEPQNLISLFGLSDYNGAILGIIIGLIILFSVINKSLLNTPKAIFWAAIVGLAIVFGWLGTHWVSLNGFESRPVLTYSFVRPVGDTLFYMMTSSGISLSFGIGSVCGVIIGAALGSKKNGQFRWEACDDPRELKRQILGACIMGPGAIIALGCSIGQGVSAFSVLAYSAPITFLAIYAGAAIGLKQLITGFNKDTG